MTSKVKVKRKLSVESSGIDPSAGNYEGYDDSRKKSVFERLGNQSAKFDRSSSFKSEKTEICHKWQLYGHCVYGHDCKYIHGDDDATEILSQPLSNFKHEEDSFSEEDLPVIARSKATDINKSDKTVAKSNALATTVKMQSKKEKKKPQIEPIVLHSKIQRPNSGVDVFKERKQKDLRKIEIKQQQEVKKIKVKKVSKDREEQIALSSTVQLAKDHTWVACGDMADIALSKKSKKKKKSNNKDEDFSDNDEILPRKMSSQEKKQQFSEEMECKEKRRGSSNTSDSKKSGEIKLSKPKKRKKSTRKDISSAENDFSEEYDSIEERPRKSSKHHSSKSTRHIASPISDDGRKSQGNHWYADVENQFDSGSRKKRSKEDPSQRDHRPSKRSSHYEDHEQYAHRSESRSGNHGKNYAKQYDERPEKRYSKKSIGIPERGERDSHYSNQPNHEAWNPDQGYNREYKHSQQGGKDIYHDAYHGNKGYKNHHDDGHRSKERHHPTGNDKYQSPRQDIDQTKKYRHGNSTTSKRDNHVEKINQSKKGSTKPTKRRHDSSISADSEDESDSDITPPPPSRKKTTNPAGSKDKKDGKQKDRRSVDSQSKSVAIVDDVTVSSEKGKSRVKEGERVAEKQQAEKKKDDKSLSKRGNVKSSHSECEGVTKKEEIDTQEMYDDFSDSSIDDDNDGRKKEIKREDTVAAASPKADEPTAEIQVEPDDVYESISDEDIALWEQSDEDTKAAQPAAVEDVDWSQLSTLAPSHTAEDHQPTTHRAANKLSAGAIFRSAGFSPSLLSPETLAAVTRSVEDPQFSSHVNFESIGLNNGSSKVCITGSMVANISQRIIQRNNLYANKSHSHAVFGLRRDLQWRRELRKRPAKFGTRGNSFCSAPTVAVDSDLLAASLSLYHKESCGQQLTHSKVGMVLS